MAWVIFRTKIFSPPHVAEDCPNAATETTCVRSCVTVLWGRVTAPGADETAVCHGASGLLQPAADAPHEQGHRLSPGVQRVLPGGAGWTPVPSLVRGSRRSITRQSCCSGSGWARGAGNTRSPPGQRGLHPRGVPAFSLELHLPQSTFSQRGRNRCWRCRPHRRRAGSRALMDAKRCPPSVLHKRLFFYRKTLLDPGRALLHLPSFKAPH